MQRNKNKLHVTVLLSALIAVGIILGKFLAFNVTEYMRFSLENLSIIFSGIVFGPLAGLSMGMVQDLVGCICVGYAVNPFITIGCGVIGFLSGFIFRTSRSMPLTLKIMLSVFLSHFAGSVIIKSAGLSIFYGTPFVITALWRILNYLTVGTFEVILLRLLLKSKQILSIITKIYPKSEIFKQKEDDGVDIQTGT